MSLSARTLATIIGDWRTTAEPAHRLLTTAVRLAVLDGRVVIGQQLPSERSLALELGVSRTTVTTAYRQLGAQGFISTSQRHRATASLPPSGRTSPRGSVAGEVLDLTSASPLAPGRLLQEAYAAAMNQLPRYLAQTGYDRTGILELRDAVARWFSSRGLATAPDQILITHGAQHALSLVAHVLLRPRATVAVEHPTYPNALELFRLLGCRMTAVPPARSLGDVDAWKPALEAADLVYLTPDFHNPSGVSIPAEVRPALRSRKVMVIDETMVALGLDGRCLPDSPPLAYFHPSALTIGSVSKCLWGGLRVGWLRAPESLVNKLARLRPATDLGNSVLDQLAVAEMLEAGRCADTDASWQRTQRSDHLRRALLNSPLDIASIERPTGGLALWVKFEKPVAAAMASHASKEGLALSAGPMFSPHGAFQRHLRIPYTLNCNQLDQVASRLTSLRESLEYT
ncbi:DNA-binding transcriptional regulator, MocR family, contains an aminotransferase domain [Brevibacterium siliguriense]|uniref:DNA-binding transcriptional regulator, MocR family, contains an aminotransferase domain n=1 Tax=Brevibacterium siliguriense TaxID=1136497 RepID=A0A1H1XLI6_9MICO|nr:PLP-dependent aminotransferase family protein [Brevibacterium siliguriense]SDT10043.1 DNA-binding transcriptional regulator, MocR family, contains an aminotransferase domain [Brevibacterium siliguriense]